MDQVNFGLVIPIIIALVGLIPALFSYINVRKMLPSDIEKAESEAADRVTAAAMLLVDPLSAKISELEKKDTVMRRKFKLLEDRLVKVEHNNYVLCDGVRRLIMQIRSLGAIPVFEIDEGLCNEMNNGNRVEVDDGHLT